MHLVLDTNILHQESLASANMKSLLRLSQSGFVTVCVPSLVRREYITKVILESSSRFQSASSNIDNILKVTKASQAHADIGLLQRGLGDLRTRLADTYEEDFDKWSATWNVRILEFAPMSITTVMDDYFSGASPFRAPKSREDLVDAMINTSIDALIEEVGSVGVVIKDGAFRMHLQQRGRVQVFDDLEAFLETEAALEEIARLDREGDISAFMGVLSASSSRAALVEYVLANQKVLDSIYLEDEQITGIEQLEMDCFGVRINGPSVGDVSSIQFGRISYVGQGQFAFDFDMKARVKVDFCASYADYLELSHAREEAVHIDSMNGIGMCDLTENRIALISGKLSVDIGAETSVAQIQGLLNAGSPGFAATRMEFEATSATLLTARYDAEPLAIDSSVARS